MDKDTDSKESPDVSRFKVDGVVAEMVIEVDEENESPRTSLAESNNVLSKESPSSTESQNLNIDDNVTSGTIIENNDESQKAESLNLDVASDSESVSKDKKSNEVKEDSKTTKEKETKLATPRIDNQKEKEKKIGSSVLKRDSQMTNKAKENVTDLVTPRRNNQKANKSKEKVVDLPTPRRDSKTASKVKEKHTDMLTSKKDDQKSNKEKETETATPVAKRGRPKKRKAEEEEIVEIESSANKSLGRPKKRGKVEEVKSEEIKSSANKSPVLGKRTRTSTFDKIESADKHIEPKRNSTRGRPKKKEMEVVEVKEKESSANKSQVGRPKKKEMEVVEVKEKESTANKSQGKSTTRQTKIDSDPPIQTKAEIHRSISTGNGLALGSIPGLSTRVEEVPKNGLRLLYRTIYNQWPSYGTTEKLVSELLQFDGFSFDKSSPEYDKRRKLLASFVDTNISLLSKILGIKAGPKSAMIVNILNFLLKPSLKVCESDKSLQPFIRLERISLDNYASKNRETDTVKKTQVLTKNATPTSVKKTKPLASKATNLQEKVILKTKVKTPTKVSTAHNKNQEEMTEIKSEILSEGEDLPSIRKSSAVLESSLSSSKSKFSEAKENGVIEISSVKTELLDGEPKDNTEDDMSEETLSSEEAAAEKKKETLAAKKLPVLMKKVQKPLVMFPNIKGSINNADLQPLQRLHILLFGASEKPEQLRHNILAFGGFPFKEGSEDWKQKEFLLSLLAPNTLREYLRLLCIDFGDEDQQAVLISKLMKFLSAPGGKAVVTQEDKAAKSILKPRTPPKTKAVAVKEVKKKPPKKEKEKKGPRHRKVLMDEAQVRRLEADIAREQRILAREKKSEESRRKSLGFLYQTPSYNSGSSLASVGMPATPPVKPLSSKDLVVSNNVVIGRKIPMNTSLVNLGEVNALLHTVYKRRALKEAGVSVSVPNTSTPTKLGDLENVKFMVVTANYNDLDILHHLIFMMDATKAKVRKNILEFAGFGFDEDAEKYKKRMDFLKSLGYDISKRIAFLLGLSSFNTTTSQQDLNELIMYFLMSPSKIKHAPIRDMPHDFFRDNSNNMNVLVLKQTPAADSLPFVKNPPSARKRASPQSSRSPRKQNLSTNPQARKATGHPVTPQNNAPLITSDGVKLFPVQKVVLPPQSVLNKPTISSNTAVPLQSLPPFILQQSAQMGSSTPPTMMPNTQIILEPLVNQPASNTGVHPEQLIVQQQTADGGPPKMFKLVKLPSNHPLATAIGNKTLHVNTQPNSNVEMKLGPPVIRVPQTGKVFRNSVSGNILPPGIILFKKDLQGNPSIQKVPSVQSQGGAADAAISSADEEYVLPHEAESQASVSDYWSNDEVEVLHPLESVPPTDAELFESIQEIIHNSNFEDITLRNVIDKVSAQFSDTNLTQRHNFMKDCVKRIIIGTS